MRLKILTFSLTLALLAPMMSLAQPLLESRWIAPISVSGQVFRGGRPFEPRLIELASQGIRTVINLQGGDLRNIGLGPIIRRWEPGEIAANIAREREVVEGLGMRFLNVPINSLAGIRPSEDRLIDEALRLMASPEARPVFIHCEFGRDRTGLLVALYRVKYEGVSVTDAYLEWKKNGHHGIAKAFTGALDRYFRRKVKEWVNACDEALTR